MESTSELTIDEADASPALACPQRQPTRRQIEVLAWVAEYRRANGYAPKLQEIADAMKLSKTRIFDHLKGLQLAGAVTLQPKKARSIEILRPELLPKRKRLVFPVEGWVTLTP